MMTVLYILMAILLFGFLIFIHECGHFWAARAVGVEINEFSIGMGPKLFSWKSKKHPTLFSVRLFPIGGFVSMVGEEEAPEGRHHVRAMREEMRAEQAEKDRALKQAEDGDAEPQEAAREEIGQNAASDLVGRDDWNLSGYDASVRTGLPEEAEPVEPALSEEEQKQIEEEERLEAERRERIRADEHAWCNKKLWQRFLVVLAGPLMNLLFGFLLMIVVVLASGHPASTVIAEFQEDALSPAYGLVVEDRIVKVGNVTVHSGNELVYEIMYHGNEPLDLVVIRDGKTIQLVDVRFPTMRDAETGVVFGNYDFKVYAERMTFGRLLYHAFWRSVSTVKMVFDSLGGLLTGRFGLNAMSGPVGITQTIATAAKTSVLSVLNLFVIISINLGVMNLLPVPALDGSKILFMLIELVRGKPVNRKVEGLIHFVGIIFLFGLMILVTFKDIASLF